jgi:UDP-N-acetylmuramate: L-alanyl-gamma-D-glutamyl-meso-diaminopimelate ligase
MYTRGRETFSLPFYFAFLSFYYFLLPFDILGRMKSYENYYLAKRNLLPDAALRTRNKGVLKKGDRVHISAVCGKAMASIACMLTEAGYQVTGSDPSFHPPMSDVLKAHHVDCRPPSIENLRGIDLFVPGNMLPASDEEVTYARENGIPMMSGAEISEVLLVPGKRSLVVAGTHGKTTTSSLLAHTFIHAERDPAYLIGGVFQHSGHSYSKGSKVSTHAIFEGDEYDCAYFDKAPKFLRYAPTSAIITSIEHDHIDLYPTFEDYKQAFQFLVEDIPKGGHLIIHQSAIQHVDISRCVGDVTLYGASSSSDVSYTVESVDETGTFFSIHTVKAIYKNIHIALFGEYNVANAVAVFVLAMKEGIEEQYIRSAFQTYPGVKERQEVLGTKEHTITVIRDFAHHPTAVTVTLQGLRDHYGDRRLVCVFEPRSITSRRKVFEHVYPEVLSHADVSIIVAPPFRPGDNTSNFMDVAAIKLTTENLGTSMNVADNPAHALTLLQSLVHTDDVVVFMSNGDFGNIPELFLRG